MILSSVGAALHYIHTRYALKCTIKKCLEIGIEIYEIMT